MSANDYWLSQRLSNVEIALQDHIRYCYLNHHHDDETGNGQFSEGNFTGDVNIDGNLTVKGDTHIEGKLTADQFEFEAAAFDNLHLDGYLEVDGKTTLNETVINDKLDVKGEATLSDTTINGQLEVTNKITGNNGLEITNGETKLKDTIIDGKLEVEQETTLNDKLNVEGTITGNNGLEITEGETKLKDTTIDGKLDVDELHAGKLTFDEVEWPKPFPWPEPLELPGPVTITGDLTVTGKINGTTSGGEGGECPCDGNFEDINVSNKTTTKELEVTSKTTLNDKLTITQNGADITGDVDIKGELEVTDKITGNNGLEVTNGETKLKDTTIDGKLGVDAGEDGPSTFTGGLEVDELHAGKLTFDEIEWPDPLELPNVDIKGNLSVEGETTLSHTTITEGLEADTIHTTGDATFDGKLEVEGESKFNDNVKIGDENKEVNLDVSGKTTTKELEVTEGSILNGETSITGESLTVSTENTTFEKDIEVEGTTTTKDLHVTNESQFDKNVTIGTEEEDADLTVKGKTTTKELEVTNNTTLNGETVIQGDSLTVTTEQTTFEKDVEVQGKITTKDVEITGELTIPEGGSLDIDGDVHIKGTLEVDKTTKLNDQLTVTKNGADITGDVNITGKETVNGPLNVNNETEERSNIIGGLDVDDLHAGKLTFDEIEWPEPLELPGPVKINGDLEVTGNTKTNTLEVTEDATFNKDITVQGESNLHDTTIDGTLHVTKESQFDKNLTIGTEEEDAELVVNGKETVKEIHVTENTTLEGNTTIQGDTFTVNAENTTINNTLTVENIEVTGELTTPEGGLELNGDLHVTGKLEVDKEVTLHEKLTAESGAEITGDVVINGKLTVDELDPFPWPDPLELPGDVKINGNLEVTGKSTLDAVDVTNDLTVGHNIETKGLDVQEDATFRKDVEINSNLSVYGESKLDHAEIKDLTVKNTAQFEDNVIMRKELEVIGKVTTHDDVEIGHNLEVKGDTKTVNLETTHDATIGKNLHVKEETQLDGNVTVGTDETPADLHVKGTLEVDQTTTLNDQLTITQNGADITGDVTIHGKLTVDELDPFPWPDPLELPGPVKINGDLEVTGTTNLKGDTHIEGDNFTIDAKNTTFNKHVKMENLTVKNIIVTGSSSGGDSPTIGPDLYLPGTLEVDQTTTLNDKLTITQNGADITGETNITGDVNITGKETVNGPLNVNNESSERSNLTGGIDIDDAYIKTLKVDKLEPFPWPEPLELPGPVTIKGDLEVEGNTKLQDVDTENLHVKGTLEVDKQTTLHKDVTIGTEAANADLIVNGELRAKKIIYDQVIEIPDDDIEFAGTVNIHKRLHVQNPWDDGDEHIRSSIVGGLDVDDLNVDKIKIKELEFDENFQWPDPIPGPMNIDGDVNITGKTTTKELEVTENTTLHDTTIDGTLHVTQESQFDANVTIGDGEGDANLTVNGTTTTNELHVTENTTLEGNTTIEGDSLTVNVENTIFQQDVTFNKNVNITEGDLTVKNIEITGNLTIPEGGSLDLDGDLHVKGTLEVDQTTKLNDKLTVTQNGADITGDVTITGSETINGALNITNESGERSEITGGIDIDEAYIKKLKVDQLDPFPWPDPLELPGPVKINGDLEVTGETTLKHTTITEGGIDVTGGIRGDTLETTGDANIGGSLDVTGDTTLNKTLRVKDNTTFEKDVEVQGNQQIQGKLQVRDNVQITEGNFTVAKGVTNLQDTNINGKLKVKGEATFEDKVFAKKNMEVNGDLNVTGDSYVTGDQHIGNDLFVNGDGSINGDLTVSGIIVGNIEISGEFKPGEGGLDVTGDTHVQGSLTVDEETHLKGDVEMGTDDKDVNVNVHGDLTITGKLEVEEAHIGKLTVDELDPFPWPDPLILPGPVTIDGELTVNDKAVFEKNVTINSEGIDVTGGIRGDTLDISGDTNLHNTVIDGTLNVTQEAQFNKNVTIGQDGDEQGADLIVKGKTITKELHVTENTTLEGDTIIQGDSLTVNVTNTTFEGDNLTFNTENTTFEKDVTFNKDVHITEGNLTVKNIEITGNLTIPEGESLDLDGDLHVKGNVEVEGMTILKDTYVDNLAADNISLRHTMEWTDTNSDKHYKSITYSDILKLYVAVGIEGAYAGYSSDGIEWNDATGLTVPMLEVKCGYKSFDVPIFVAIGDTKPYTAYSTDGINWTMGNLPDLDKEGHYCGLIVANRPDATLHDSIFTVCTSQTKTTTTDYLGYDQYTSTDGINWSKAFLPSYRLNKYHCGYASPYQGDFSIFGQTGYYLHSYDGVVWRDYTLTFNTNESATTIYNWLDMTCGEKYAVLICDRETNNVGVYNQLNLANPIFTTIPNAKLVEYGNNWYVIITKDGETYYSADCKEWLQIEGLNNTLEEEEEDTHKPDEGTPPPGREEEKQEVDNSDIKNWNDLVVGGDRWVIVGDQGIKYFDMPVLHVSYNNAINLTPTHTTKQNEAVRLEALNTKTYNMETDLLNVKDAAIVEAITVRDKLNVNSQIVMGGIQTNTYRVDTNNNLPPYNWKGIAFGNGKFVVCATAGVHGPGAIAYSGDGKNWTLCEDIPCLGWKAIAFGNGRFVVAGQQACLISIDGVTWEMYPTTNSITLLSYGNGLFIGVYGDPVNKMMYSYDGTKWWEIPWPFVEDTKSDRLTVGDIAYGGGIWLMSTSSSSSGADNIYYMMRSYDGFHWFADTEFPKGNCEGLCWAPVGGAFGTWVAVNHVSVGPYYSLDGGITWKNNYASNYCYTKVLYGAGIFLAPYPDHAQASYNFYYSSDGITWNTDKHPHTDGEWEYGAYGNGVFVLISSNTMATRRNTVGACVVYPNDLSICASMDKIVLKQSYTGNLGPLKTAQVTAPVASIRSIDSLQQINGMDIGWLFRTVMELKRALEDRELPYGEFYGLNPNKWTNIEIPKVYNKLYLLNRVPLVYYVVNTNTREWAYSSDEGNTWIEGTGYGPFVVVNGYVVEEGELHEEPTGMYDVKNRIVGYGLGEEPSNGTLYRYAELYSGGGPLSWTENSSTFHPNKMTDAAYGCISIGDMQNYTGPDGYYLFVGDGGMVYSKTGIDSYQAFGVQDKTENYSSVCFAKGKFVVLLNNGSVGAIYSTDSITNWQETNLTPREWVKIRYYNYGCGWFVALSTDGYLGYSKDGVEWKEYRFSTEGGWKSFASGNGLIMIVKDNKYMYTVDFQRYYIGTYEFENINDIFFGEGKFILCTNNVNGLYVCE